MVPRNQSAVWHYSIDHTRACELRKLAVSDTERAAVDRLEEFEGDANDIISAAYIYTRARRSGDGRALLAMLEGH